MQLKLDEIAQTIGAMPEDSAAWLDRTTGEVIVVAEEYLRLAEDDEPDDDRPEWMVETIAEARAAMDHPERYLALPTRWEIHEYAIMESFCREREDPEIRDRLLRAISGRGAFRVFKAEAADLGLLDDWFAYRDRAIGDIVAEWCREHGIEFAPR